MKSSYCECKLNLAIVAGLLLIASAAWAHPRFVRHRRRSHAIARTNLRNLASLGGTPGTVQIRGQTRNLSMMLIMKNGKDEINFIKPRKDYHNEVLSTPF